MAPRMDGGQQIDRMTEWLILVLFNDTFPTGFIRIARRMAEQLRMMNLEGCGRNHLDLFISGSSVLKKG
jgi:hypothetical protein